MCLFNSLPFSFDLRLGGKKRHSMPRYSVEETQVGDEPRVVFLRDSETLLHAGICPQRGAELCSLSSRGVELLHRALDFAPAGEGGWYGHGQLLFPAVGRQKGGIYAFPAGSEQRPMPLHGFASAARFAIARSGADGEDGAFVECMLESGFGPHEHLAASEFPFAFNLTITFRVRDGVLSCGHRVANPVADRDALLPFSIGNHISLAFPFEPSEAPTATWSAGRLLGTASHAHALTDGSLLSGEVDARPELQSARGMALTAPGATNGVLGFAGNGDTDCASRLCSLVLVQPGSFSVEVAHAVEAPASAAGDPAPACDWRAVSANRFFVLWGEAPKTTGERGFLCPEPWVGGPDSLNTGRGLMVLRGGEECTWTFSVGVGEEKT